jgi:mitogen-activated protein kinase organizer 1
VIYSHTTVQVLTPSNACICVLCAAGRVLFWELVEATLVSTLQAHSSVVCGLAAHPTDKVLLTAAVDGTVKVWQ